MPVHGFLRALHDTPNMIACRSEAGLLLPAPPAPQGTSRVRVCVWTAIGEQNGSNRCTPSPTPVDEPTRRVLGLYGQPVRRARSGTARTRVSPRGALCQRTPANHCACHRAGRLRATHVLAAPSAPQERPPRRPPAAATEHEVTQHELRRQGARGRHNSTPNMINSDAIPPSVSIASQPSRLMQRPHHAALEADADAPNP